MAMIFSGADRPNRLLEKKVNEGKTPYENILLSDNNDFQSILASKRYDVVIQNVRRYNNFDNPIQNSLGEISFRMGTSTSDVLRIEQPYRKQLEKLAVELVCRELSIPKGAIDFDAKIVGVQEIDNSKFNRKKDEETKPESSKQNEEILDLERKKRRLVNSMIQGAAKKGHYMYHLVEGELKEITKTDELIHAYNIMMSVNDTYYWQVDDNTMESIVSNSNAVGTSEVDFPEDYDEDDDANPKIIARGINFPVLVHELVKGVIELYSYHGQNENKELASQVIELEDRLHKELWDLRYGPALWDMYREQLPNEVLIDDDKLELQNYLLVDVFKLEPTEFISLIEDIIYGRANKKLTKMVNDIKIRLASQDYEATMRNFGMWDEE